jgi:hypothetical protein
VQIVQALKPDDKPRRFQFSEDMDKWKFLTLSGLELRPLGRPARSESLYRLSYPGAVTSYGNLFKCQRVRLRKAVHTSSADLILRAMDTGGPMFAISTHLEALLSSVYEYKT